MTEAGRVMGVLDAMINYAFISAQMGDDLDHTGRVVSRVIQHFNSTSEPTYRVGDCGPSLSVLGEQVTQVDSFVKSIADALRKADTSTISMSMGADVTGPMLAEAAALERAAGDVALFYLLRNFSTFDAMRNGRSDGTISMRDIEAAAIASKDLKIRASAQWLLEHREVLRAIDEADDRKLAGPDGEITAKDVARYMKQRAAFRVFSENIALFDDPDPNARDHKVSRGDIERMVKTSTDPNIKAAARYILDDHRVLNGQVTFGDRLAGKYDLSNVAKRYAEPKSPLPLQKNWVRDIGCGAAQQFSYLGYIDMVSKVLEKDPTVIFDIEGEVIQETTLRLLIETSTRESAKRSAAVMASPQFALAATAVDGLCRVTEPRKNWGTVRAPSKRTETKGLTGPPASKEILSKLNAPNPAR